LAERLITFAKRGDLHARRQVLTVVRDKDVVAHLFAEIGPRFENRPGGYTRIVKVGPRKGDNAPMAVIELVTEEYSPKPKTERTPAAAAPVPAAEEAPADAPAEAGAEVEAPEAEAAPAEVEAPAAGADETEVVAVETDAETAAAESNADAPAEEEQTKSE